MVSRSRCCAADPPHINCAQVTDCVATSAVAGNIMARDTAGLLVPAPTPAAILPGRGVAVTTDPGGGNEVAARLSAQAANALALGVDGGLYLPASRADGIVSVQSTPTLGLAVAAKVLTATAVVSGAPGNLLGAAADGLLAPTSGLNPSGLVSATPGNALAVGTGGRLYTPVRPQTRAGNGLYLAAVAGGPAMAVGAGPGTTTAAGVLALRRSADGGNRLTFGADGGVYATPVVPPAGAPAAVADTPTVDMTLAASRVSGAAVVSPFAGNVLSAKADGLFATTAAAATPASLISAQSGNRLVLGGDAKMKVTTASQGNAKPLAGPALAYNGSPAALGLIADATKATSTLPAGAGTKIQVNRSADAGNTVVFGTDTGLHMPKGAAGTIRAAYGGLRPVSEPWPQVTVNPNSNMWPPMNFGFDASNMAGAPFGHYLSAADRTLIIDEGGLFFVKMTYSVRVAAGQTPRAITASATLVGGGPFGDWSYGYLIPTTWWRIREWSGMHRFTAGQGIVASFGSGPGGTPMTMDVARILLYVERIGN